MFLCELDAVEELIEEKHWVINAVQKAYYTPLARLLLNPDNDLKLKMPQSNTNDTF